MPKHEGNAHEKKVVSTGTARSNQSEPEKEEVAAYSKKSHWLVLGNGSYNRVWRSAAPDKSGIYRVLKYPLPSNDSCVTALSHNQRGVRLWNEINSPSRTGLPEAITSQSGWIAPYIANTRPATDEETANKVVEVYQATRRIVLDAATRGNVLTRLDTGEVIVVDVDLALNLRNSTASLNFAETLHERFQSYWNDPDLNKNMPNTLEVTRNLIFLEEQLSSKDIDTLASENHLTLANLKSLSWLRRHNKPLTQGLFLELLVLNQANIEISDILFESLTSNNEEKQTGKQKEKQKDKQSSVYPFFMHANHAAFPVNKASSPETKLAC
ncbi:hypothetical protein [Legionella taurinensis]|uniref:Uncharacterized protein n=1 Tax=Legionella taurinensis TaxID=70611 RepID=A0A3A5L2S7_9GAMM|nr:hypothetical protein [Legionella taurinensis]RJT45614.1 hypothetical protein D6J04_10845 [Legionella taurinensis]RJT66230.1 hypothetical protein D6J03_11490 [Legionella taurinensis]STY26242.1 Uncharacterised protein [Legionella taurinensis]